jgi:hypothetical protein
MKNKSKEYSMKSIVYTAVGAAIIVLLLNVINLFLI